MSRSWRRVPDPAGGTCADAKVFVFHADGRLRGAAPALLDNRISYGCINVPPEFFKNVVSPAFKSTNGIVYILPETRSPQSVFASYDVDERARQRSASQGLPVYIASQAEAN